MKRDVLVYISGPISPKNGRSVEANVSAAVAVYIDLTRLGIPSICVHLGAMFPSCHAALSYDAWMALDFALIDHCSHVLMMDGWQLSSGAVAEGQYAMDQAMPIAYSVAELCEMVGVEWPEKA